MMKEDAVGRVVDIQQETRLRMRVVVTGGRGFVGRYVLSALEKRGIGGLAISRQSFRVDSRFEVAVGELTDAAFVHRTMKGATHVIHCAGEKTSVSRMVAANVEATRNLVTAAKVLGLQRFIHLSSVGVIGKVSTPLVDEHTPCRPMNFYERTKREAEEIVAKAGLPGAILRPTNVFGPENVGSLVTGSSFKRFVVGKENAHLVYVEDVAAAVLFALLRSSSAMETFIVSSDDERGNTMGEVSQRVAGGDTPLHAPFWVPYLLRLGRHRRANWGARIYSPRKLTEAGFVRPFGLVEGLHASLRTERSDGIHARSEAL